MMKKNYLIIGASSGIGAACARELFNDADNLILVGRNKERLDAVSEECGCNTHVCVYDLNDLNNLKDIFSVCKEKGFRLDGMVYSAGINADCPIKVSQISLMQEAMTVNCFAFIEAGKYFYSKSFSNDGASIVAISSISSITCEKGMALYSASKAALNAVVKTMAKEYSRRQIRVNAILPAGVDTPMARQKMAALGTVKEPGRVEDTQSGQYLGLIPDVVVAHNARFLMSQDSVYTTGELMIIGAGLEY